MSDYDCTIYNSPNCPKGLSVHREINSGVLNVLSVGCFGTYCWDGEITKTYWKEVENKDEIIDRILINMLEKSGVNKAKKEVGKLSQEEKEKKIQELTAIVGFDILDLFERETDIYGQKSVVEGMAKYTSENNVASLFLAGDNIYSYKVPKEALIELIKNAYEGKAEYPSKKQYRLDPAISGHNIDKQLSEGFLDCFQGVEVKDFFLGVGNHDVQNCYDLNQQLKFNQNLYKMVGMYYNVRYVANTFSVNFLVIDTNMFSEKSTCNPKIAYTDDDRKKQIEWVISTLEENKSDWNVMVGHVPYKANGHKEKDPKIYNKGLEEVFQAVQKTGIKVQIYMCADEHNQQFLYDPEKKLSLIVAGSGGTALDYEIQTKKSFMEITKYLDAVFGFVSFSFTETVVDITFIKSEVGAGEKVIPNFRVKVGISGDIVAV